MNLRVWGSACVLGMFGAVISANHDRAAARPARDQSTAITYLAPIWSEFTSASESELDGQAALLRSRIGEGPFVKLGFTTYLVVAMEDWHVDITSPAEVRAQLGTFEAQLDQVIGRARSRNLALVITLLTAIRERTDPAQRTSFNEDRRVMQWYADNTVATGWWTHSRYARRQYAVREAYMREVAKILAAKMAADPETLVAVAGDGEVELSIARMNESGGPVVADYSPFAIAEFRDWLRAEGLYATGQPLAGEAFANAARYTGDATPGGDTNGDGHTLNGDYGTSFATWSLKHFDWSLTHPAAADPSRIPEVAYQAPAFNPLAVAPGLSAGFDAPRTIAPASSWWTIWARFRETMIWRHNRDLARWMTTTVNDNGDSIPATHWYSYQIPADYVFGYTPANPDVRLVASASPWWTANVDPYAGMGFTSFATHQGGGVYARTLPGLLGAIRSCGAGETPPTCLADSGGLAAANWGIFEWNPAVPGTNDPSLYLEEIRRLRRYRPRVLAPYSWGYREDHPVLDSGFETALRQLVAYVGEGWSPTVTTAPAALRFTATRAGGTVPQVSGTQTIVVGQPTGGTVDWTASTNQPWLSLGGASGHGDGFLQVSMVAPQLAGLAAGLHTATVTIAAPGSVEGTRAVTVTVNVADTLTSSPPFGAFDTPVNSSTVQGSFAVTGWALDDVEIDRVEIWRDAVPNDPAPPFNETGHPANGKIFIANGTFVSGGRPDVAGLYPTTPFAHRAGWGYFLLSRGLPNSNGTFVLTAIAWDKEGQSTVLGTKTIVVNNAAATKPFGSIDVPAYGATFSGHNWTYGWALTPNAGCTMSALSGGQVFMTIDSAPPNFPVNYGDPRADIAASFPGFTDSAGAGGAVLLNSSNYPSGSHAIGWLAYDSCGNGEGVGSRFFTILNGAGDGRAARDGDAGALRLAAADLRAPASAAPLWIVRGMGTPATRVDRDATIWLSQTGRIELHVTEPRTQDPGLGTRFAAYLAVNGTLESLPLGSSFDSERGVFYWQPVAGFLGEYPIRLVKHRDGIAEEQWTARVVVSPGADDVLLHIDSAECGVRSAQAGVRSAECEVAGWGLDPSATAGGGIAAVHVWATKIGAAAPFFLGHATLGVTRTDVGERYGAQFNASGYRLTLPPMAPGTYDVVVYAWSVRSGQWAAARTIRVIVR